MLSFDDFSHRLNQFGPSPHARLRGLTQLLSDWNRQREARTDLTQQQVEVLQQLIHGETRKLKRDDADVLAEQILFLLIGALRRDPQQQSSQMWQMVNQGIDAFVQPQQNVMQNSNFIFLLAIVLMLGLATSHLVLHKTPEAKLYPDEISQSESRRATINSLVMLHEEMRKGFCQIPQAAMLENTQRESFIRFINQGQINIESADDLKKALSFVSCLYPQKLMDNPLNQ